MYKTKPRFTSNSGELAGMVLDEIRALAPVDATVVRLSYAKLPVGLWFQEAPEDGSGRQDTLTPR